MGALSHLVDRFLEPHPTGLLLPVPRRSIGPAFRLPDLIARLAHILDDVKLVLHHLNVSNFVAHSFGVGCSHVDGHVLDNLRIAVVPHHFRGNSPQDMGIFSGCCDESSLHHHVSEYCMAAVPFALVCLFNSQPHHVV